MDRNDISHFSYEEKDFYLKIQEDDELSKFDKSVKEKWCKAEQENVFRYSVKSQYKVLEGKYGFYAQLNTERATMRRKPEPIQSMLQPFDPNRFNFTKLSHKEILFDIGDGSGNDIVAVNVSPITHNHCLLLPQRLSGLPQIVTFYSLKKALEILLISKSVNMRVLFNSLCANASVNHLHWHFYYLNNRMLLEWIPLETFIGSIQILENYPAKGFCIKYSSFKDQSLNEYITYTYKLISCLQENQIAHNISIIRSKASEESTIFDDIRIYIWARTAGCDSEKAEDFRIGAYEVFGHVPIRTAEAYEHLNEEYVSQRLQEITSTEFLRAKEKIKSIFEKNQEEKNSHANAM